MAHVSMDARLYSPFTALISGPTGSGKTTILLEMIKNSQRICTPPPVEIIYCYSIWQPVFETVKYVNFHKGLIDVNEKVFNDGQSRWLIIDDLMDEVAGGKEMNNLFTKQSHHLNISVFFIVQNLFHKKIRQISLNSHYMFLFNSPRDRSAIRSLGMQLKPSNPNFVVDVYNEITSDIPYSHLFIDLKQTTSEKHRYRNGFAGNPNGELIVYCEKKKTTNKKK